MFAAGVDSKFLDEHVLNGLEECWTSNGLSTTDTKSTTGAVASCIHLTTAAAAAAAAGHIPDDN